jgi:hypothetical protein
VVAGFPDERSVSNGAVVTECGVHSGPQFIASNASAVV